MRLYGLVSSVVGAALVAFGVWGLFSNDGRRHFDEMAGIIPFYGMVGGVVLGDGRTGVHGDWQTLAAGRAARI